MSSVDFQTLNAEEGFLEHFDGYVNTQNYHPSQFEMHSVMDPTMNVYDTYPVPLNMSVPYVNTTTSIGMPAESNFDDSENYQNACYVRHQANSVPSTSTVKAGSNYRSRGSYNGRRSTNDRRDRINERERDRMHMLCDAFERLRHVLPLKKPKRGPHRQKLSKMSTLLFAQSYIQTMEDILRNPAQYADCRLAPSSDETNTCVNRSPEPHHSSFTNSSHIDAEYSELLNPSESYHQYSNDMFVGDSSFAPY